MYQSLKGLVTSTFDRDKSPVWIGLHVTDSDGIEKAWADCAQYSWTKWHPSQPNNPNVNRCVYLQKLTANFWMDPCNTPHYFICENIDASKLFNTYKQ